MNIHLQITWSPAYDTSKMTRGKEIRVHTLHQLLWAMHIAVRTLGEILLFRPADSSSCQVQNYWRVPSYACRLALSAVPNWKKKRSSDQYPCTPINGTLECRTLHDRSNELSKDAGNISATNVKINGDPLTRGEERVQDDQQRLCLHSAFRGLTASTRFGVRQSATHKSRIAAPCFHKQKKKQVRKTRTLHTLRPLSKHKAR